MILAAYSCGPVLRPYYCTLPYHRGNWDLPAGPPAPWQPGGGWPCTVARLLQVLRSSGSFLLTRTYLPWPRPSRLLLLLLLLRPPRRRPPPVLMLVLVTLTMSLLLTRRPLELTLQVAPGGNARTKQSQKIARRRRRPRLSWRTWWRRRQAGPNA